MVFAAHHYLSQALAKNAACFLATWRERAVAFSAWVPYLGTGPPGRREHRTVALPDYQGIGIGNALSATSAALWKALGYRATSTTTHPALIAARRRSPLWRMHRRPSLSRKRPDRMRHATTRLTAGFTYVGPSMKLEEARALHG